MSRFVSSRWLSAAAILVILSVYGVLKLYSLHPVVGDENIYFYLAGRLADGLLPYRDFAFAHPPLHIYLLGAVAWLSDGSFIALKSVPSILILLTALCLWMTARRTSLGQGGSVWWPVLPMGFFLLNYDVLRASSHCTGVNQATFFLMLGMATLLAGRPWLAGLGFACALSTATYVLPPIFMMALLRAWRAESRRKEMRLLGRVGVSAAASFVAIHLPTWILAGREWWRQTILFHGRKPPIGSTFRQAFHEFLSAEGFLVAASLVVLAVAVSGRTRLRGAWLPALGLAHVAALIPLERIYVYYLLPASPFLALGGAMFLRWVTVQTGGRATRTSGLVILAGALAVQPAAYLILPGVRKDPGRVKEYEFRPTPGIGPVNSLISLILPRRRIVGLIAPGVVRYLWHESAFWENAGDLSRWVDGELSPGGTLYGDSTTTPLLAFLSGRRIACELADTNTMQFRTGTRHIPDDLACGRQDGLELVVIQPGRGIGGLPEMARFLEQEAELRRRDQAGIRPLTIFGVRHPY